MDGLWWLVEVAGLAVWLGLPILLLWTVTWSRSVRIGFGAALVVILTILYSVFVGWIADPRQPEWAEAALFWGPVTLLARGVAWAVDRRRARRAPNAGAAGGESAARRRWGAVLAAGITALSVCCGVCLFSWVAEFVDLRLTSPDSLLVLPLPEDLTLISVDRGCGSGQCSDIYLIGSPDGVSSDEVAERLWAHLETTKGWQRLRDDAGCRQHGWLLRHEFCGFIRNEPGQPDGTLRFHVSGALAVATPATPAGSVGRVGTVGLW
ncbi:MAG: hypothetical protein IRY85_07095 [Micromonosporaceae bacterium]|nr:hypothetical protein [Micromonosporaceae bacterium]